MPFNFNDTKWYHLIVLVPFFLGMAAVDEIKQKYIKIKDKIKK